MFHGLFASALAETASTAGTQPALDMGKLMNDGLTTTVYGLGGVFLVLCIFYSVIKLMQKVKDKEPADEE